MGESANLGSAKSLGVAGSKRSSRYSPPTYAEMRAFAASASVAATSSCPPGIDRLVFTLTPSAHDVERCTDLRLRFRTLRLAVVRIRTWCGSQKCPTGQADRDQSRATATTNKALSGDVLMRRRFGRRSNLACRFRRVRHGPNGNGRAAARRCVSRRTNLRRNRTRAK